jgi:hypothetical protein
LGRLISLKINIDARAITLEGTTTIICPAGQRGVAIRIVEIKDEMGEGDSDPTVQAECGFVLIYQCERFRCASCCPMFLVGVAGPDLAVSGAIFAERFVSQRFTDYIYYFGPLPTCREQSALDHGGNSTKPDP